MAGSLSVLSRRSLFGMFAAACKQPEKKPPPRDYDRLKEFDDKMNAFLTGYNAGVVDIREWDAAVKAWDRL